MLRAFFVALLFTLLLGTPARAQFVEDYNPPPSNCCWLATAKTLSDQMQDWNQLGRFHSADEELMKQPPDPKRVVFLGDSITEGWHLQQFFPGKPYVNRGIGGQTTPQMLVRTYPDVIDLKPAAVIILAGTNDIAQNTGPETLTMVEENFQAIIELAQRHGIKVILCLVTPVGDYSVHKWTEHRPPSDILKLNAWLREYAAKTHAVLADYYSVLVDEKGAMRQSDSDDGLHPNAKGYELMVPVAESAIERALH